MTAKGQDPVKAIVQDRFGPPDVLRLSDTGLPEAGPDDVLVRVHAAALNPADWHILRGDPLVARLRDGRQPGIIQRTLTPTGGRAHGTSRRG